MKFKGYILKMGKEEYTLKEQLGEGGFSLIYTTHNPQTICKIQVISQSNIAEAYRN